MCKTQQYQFWTTNNMPTFKQCACVKKCACNLQFGAMFGIMLAPIHDEMMSTNLHNFFVILIQGRCLVHAMLLFSQCAKLNSINSGQQAICPISSNVPTIHVKQCACVKKCACNLQFGAMLGIMLFRVL